MRRPYIIATTAAGAALAAGLIAAPAFAGSTSTATPTPSASTSTTCPCGATGTAGGGWGMQYGRGGGAGMAAGSGRTPGAGMGPGMGRWGSGSTAADPLAGLTQGTLTSDQKTALAGMAEEEKLAHDVYVALAADSKDVRFTRIATAESQHLTEVRALLTRYGIADPTAGKADGVFATAAIQQQYKDLVARGSASLDAALAVGRDIEKADLAALDKARTGVTAQDVSTVYTRLTNGSQMHLRAFGG
jgi:hypothetical protein